jgi:arylsulfatase A-like enzyme
MGLNPAEWLLTPVPTLLYWAFLAAFTLAFHGVASRLVSSESARALIPLVATTVGSLLLWIAIRAGLEESLQFNLNYALAGSLGTLCLTWTLRRFAGFSFGPAIVAGIGAITAAALSLSHAGAAMVIRAFGFGVAAENALEYALVLSCVGAVAGAIGAHRPAMGWSLALAGCLIGVGMPAVAILRAEAPAPKRENQQPNILLITADTMRADYASLYGGPAPTPVLEELARRGARFDSAISLAPWTVPSLSGLFSSKYPPSVSSGVRGEERAQELTLYGQIPAYWLGEEGHSFPERVRDLGYDTAAFVSNFAMRKQRWLIDGFDRHLIMAPVLEKLDGPFVKSPFLRSMLRSLWPSLYELRPFDYTRPVTELATGYLRSQKHRPFFLWAHYVDPHTPYDPPAEFRSMSGSFPFYPYEKQRHGWDERDYVRSLYAAEISYVDDSIGKVLRTLEALGLSDQTYVVFASDHGEELWDHAGFGHGHSMFDELLHVPLVIAGPGIATQTIAKTVSFIDLLPTMADWLGIAADPSWRGTSWAGALRRGSFPPGESPVFAQSTGVLPPPPEPLQAVILGRYKLIRGMESGTLRLYDRSADPLEQNNRAGAHPRIVAQMKAALDRWSKSFPVSFEVFAAEGQELEADPEMIENLKALGYLPSDSP